MLSTGFKEEQKMGGNFVVPTKKLFMEVGSICLDSVPKKASNNEEKVVSKSFLL